MTPPTLGAALKALGLWSSAAAAAPDCQPETFEGDRFTVCSYRAATDELRLAKRGRDGLLGNMAALRRSLGNDASRVKFAMNAGMYDGARQPLGLFIAGGRIVRPINTASGSGNFFLRPNGVFWIDNDNRPHVDETGALLAAGTKPRWATQSGPLLVQAGALHPAIAVDGSSRLVRNGVGIRGAEALFAISDGAVSFGRFARFLRDGLGCRDALYFDGVVSSLWAPASGRDDHGNNLGTFVVVLQRKP